MSENYKDKFTKELIRNAYDRLRTFIYYDSSDILLRAKFVNFDTSQDREEKLLQLEKELASEDIESEYFKRIIGEIGIDFYPKKFADLDQDAGTFYSNQRIKEQYHLKRLTPFMDAPIELYIVSILWIIKQGYQFDSDLDSSCLGNRLLLKKDKSGLEDGTSLFKPYFKQYQKWRDSSVKVAKDLLLSDNSIVFLNLDFKDYYHSVRLDNKVFSTSNNKIIGDLLLKVHHTYTQQLYEEYNFPDSYLASRIEKDGDGNYLEFILPIGFPSSYVLANDFLKEFDIEVRNKIKPAYYGRYVDDILLVVNDPDPSYNSTLPSDPAHINPDDNNFNESERCDLGTSFKSSDLSRAERYIFNLFNCLIGVYNSPFITDGDFSKTENRVLKMMQPKGFLFFQSSKTLIHHFVPNESDLVIERLRRELEERSSEFRDMPDPNETMAKFENNAYYLNYTGTDGKIQTLKDYQENRFGLTVYLANEIFSSLRHNREFTITERKQILQFFKGINCLEFYRLWERIFTLFLIKNDRDAYSSFYSHCIEEIRKIQIEESESHEGHIHRVKAAHVQKTLILYFESVQKLVLSLNPDFLNKLNGLKVTNSWSGEDPSSDIYLNGSGIKASLRSWRKSNMLRHHYITTPLLSYTTYSTDKLYNLLSPPKVIDFKFDDILLDESPRRVKFWECCIAAVHQELSGFNSENGPRSGYIETDILREEDNHYLKSAFRIFQEINTKHLPNVFSNLKLEDLIKLEKQDGGVWMNKIGTDKGPLKKVSVSFGNTNISRENIVNGLRGQPNTSAERYQKVASILKAARKAESNLVLFPEFFIPIELLSSLTAHSGKHQCVVVTGLEHHIINDVAFNFVVTILPFEKNGIKDAAVLFRLKNHYAPEEELLIKGNHKLVPKPEPFSYDVINWRNLYFSVYYCFELADISHRSLLKGKVDLLIGVEYNSDTTYFSNIVESCSRDIHCYFAQVNSANFGDTRLTQPVKSVEKDILRLKGGRNDTILVGEIDIHTLREFQRQKYKITKIKKAFKPLPPNFLLEDVLTRINNK